MGVTSSVEFSCKWCLKQWLGHVQNLEALPNRLMNKDVAQCVREISSLRIPTWHQPYTIFCNGEGKEEVFSPISFCVYRKAAFSYLYLGRDRNLWIST